MTAALNNLSTTLIRSRALQLKALRSVVMKQLYPVLTGTVSSPTDQAVVQLANTFSRYAQTQSTYADEAGPSRPSIAGSANLLERQVSRAIAQVLGRAPGSSPESFIRAINDVFPVRNNGQVSLTPSRSAVSMYGQSSDSTMNGAMSAGLVGQLSAEQATLYRQASVIAADAQKVLQGLQPIVPEADLDKVDALRALVASEINSLVEEFGRVDEPRARRVKTYFDQLRGPNGHLIQFGDRAFLDQRRVVPTTLEDEAQVTGYQLLVSYVQNLQATWNQYQGNSSTSNNLRYPEFSLRLSRASVLLPVIAEGNQNLMSALDSIGFTETVRRSSASRFTYLSNNPNPRPRLPDMTVSDLNEWLDRFASLEGPSYLADSGQYGLESVTDQANQLFWVLAPIMSFLKTQLTINLSGQNIIVQALNHERVRWALDDLTNQLKALADLAA
jgi:hypothetical protein